jgi:hypothetical protein
MFFTAMLITYIKGGTSAQIFLERGSAMTRATFVIFRRRSLKKLTRYDGCQVMAIAHMAPLDQVS